MPGGHASHKSTGNKPNTNANGLINLNAAADESQDPEDVLQEGILTNTTRTQEFVDFPPAIERPSDPRHPDAE